MRMKVADHRSSLTILGERAKKMKGGERKERVGAAAVRGLLRISMIDSMAIAGERSARVNHPLTATHGRGEHRQRRRKKPLGKRRPGAGSSCGC